VVSGTAYKIGQILVVATATVAATLPFEGKVTGVFELPKTTGQVWAEGDLLYWDDTTKKLTDVVAGGDLLAGCAANPGAASGATVGNCRMNAVARPDGVSDVELEDNAVDTAAIQDLAVTTGKLAVDAVDGTKLADNAVDSEHIAAGAIDPEHFAAGSVSAVAVDFFKSAEATGTGSPQNIAHGLSSTPGLVWWSLSEFADTLAVDFAEGAHDGTNLVVTVTSGAKFFIYALGA